MPNDFHKRLARAKAIEKKNREKLLLINNKLDDESGIYFLTRVDEEGFKYAYVGQAVKIMTRMCQHLVGYQHIDLSLKKHKFYDVQKNPYGWKVNFLHFPKSKLDEMEKKYIKEYALKGYQLRNKTSGSQGVGKSQIDDYKPSKGYRDGLKQGEKNLARKLNDIIDKHLVISLKDEKKNNKISQRAYDKFFDLLKGD